MKAKRWLVIGSLVMAMQAGFSLPAMADNEAQGGSNPAITGPIWETVLCEYLESLPELPSQIDDLMGCEFAYLNAMSSEIRALFLEELSQPYASPEALGAEVASESEPEPQPAPEPTPPADTSYGGGVEQWRGLVQQYFRAEDVDHALSVIDCESIGGNAGAVNPSSGASGLFQHMPRYWAERSAAAGWAGADIFDPEANIAVAAWLAYSDGWGHWPNCGCALHPHQTCGRLPPTVAVRRTDTNSMNSSK